LRARYWLTTTTVSMKPSTAMLVTESMTLPPPADDCPPRIELAERMSATVATVTRVPS